MPLKRNTMVRTMAAAAAIALTTTGCLASKDDDGGGGSDGGSGGGDGKVTIAGAFTGPEQEAFEASLAEFEEDSDIDIEYSGDSNFATLIGTQVQGGTEPDIGLFPQPGLLLQFSDSITPIEDVIDIDDIEETLIPGFLESATGEDGKVYGAPMRMAVKSLVWVPKGAWEERDLTVEPTSVQELIDIGDDLKGEGITPWCIGIEDGGATGWVGTDWIEEFMLRVNGPEVYDQWVKHEIPFNDPQVVAAFDAFQELLGPDDENAFGGRNGITTTSFKTAGNNAFTDPPKCMMQRQGNFITGFWPDDVQADLAGSVDVMPFPAWEGGYDGTPVLGGGDLAAAFHGEDEDVQEVMEFLTSDEFGGPWAESGGWLSPHKTFDTNQYADPTTQAVAEVAVNADVFRFDGSDLMPGDVGAGTFWSGMVAWFGGEDTQKVVDDIEKSWPTS